MGYIFNIKMYKERRQRLRNNMTEPEKRLWEVLCHCQMGVKFRRQHGIGYYIADFYCPSLKLVLEVDGSSHFSRRARLYDSKRDDFMLSLGIKTIRISNDDVMRNMAGVKRFIKRQIVSRAGVLAEK